MIEQKKLELEIYNLLFPTGIPIGTKGVISAIDSRIGEIHVLARGGTEPQSRQRRISDPFVSADLNRRIDALRAEHPRMSYAEISVALGGLISASAVRCRISKTRKDKKAERDKIIAALGTPIQSYAPRTIRPGLDQSGPLDPEGKTEPSSLLLSAPGLQPATVHIFPEVRPVAAAPPAMPELSEKAATQEEKPPENKEADIKGPGAPDSKLGEKAEIECGDHIVESDKMVCSPIVDLTKIGKYGKYDVPISAEVDAEIHRLSSGGMPTTGVSNELAKKGILISWQRVRSVLATTARLKAKAERTKTAENVAPVHPEVVADPSHPGVEGPPLAERVSPRGTPEGKPEPKNISRADLNIRIWDAWKAGDSPEEISRDLNDEGYFYDERQVTNRLKQQGADL
jgi:hypothetical protein